MFQTFLINNFRSSWLHSFYFFSFCSIYSYCGDRQLYEGSFFLQFQPQSVTLLPLPWAASTRHAGKLISCGGNLWPMRYRKQWIDLFYFIHTLSPMESLSTFYRDHFLGAKCHKYSILLHLATASSTTQFYICSPLVASLFWFLPCSPE